MYGKYAMVAFNVPSEEPHQEQATSFPAAYLGLIWIELEYANPQIVYVKHSKIILKEK